MTFQNRNVSYEMYINILYKKKKHIIFFSIIYTRFVHEFVASVNNNKNKTRQSVFA